jgi:hypothetical protein
MTIVILHFGLVIEYIIARKMLIIYIIKIIFANEIKNKYIIIILNKNMTIYTINHSYTIIYFLKNNNNAMKFFINKCYA